MEDMKRLIIIVFVFSNVWVFAQDDQPANLTFKEAVKIALEKNVTLNQQKNTLFSREVQKNQSMASFLPSLGIQGYAQRNDGQQPNPDGGELENLTVDNLGAGLYANMDIFSGFNKIHTLNQGINQFKAQASLVERAEQDVIFNVTNQYLQVLLDQELLKIAEENHKTQQVVLDQMQEQANLGARAEAESYSQQSQVGNMQLLALRAKITLDNDKAALAQTLQLDPSIPFIVTFPTFQEGFGSLDGVVLDSLYTVALANRKDLQQAEYQMKANQYSYKSSINGILPRVSLFASYTSQYISTVVDNPVYGDFNNQFGKVFPSSTYGVNLTIPIFDRLVTRSSRVTNKVIYDNSKLQYDNLEKSIKIGVQQAFNNYKSVIQAYHASQIQFQAGELSLQTQQESFLLGVSSQVALAQANQIYVQAAASKAQAEVTLTFQKILLDYALGTLKFEDIE